MLDTISLYQAKQDALSSIRTYLHTATTYVSVYVSHNVKASTIERHDVGAGGCVQSAGRGRLDVTIRNVEGSAFQRRGWLGKSMAIDEQQARIKGQMSANGECWDKEVQRAKRGKR